MSRRLPWAFPATRLPICTSPSGSRPCTNGSARKCGGRSRRSGATGTPIAQRPTRRAAARAVEPARSRWRRTSAVSCTRLFDVDAPAAAIAESTRAQDDLFRFKVDFVRRRALPLLKGGARTSRPTPEDDAIVDAADRRARRRATASSPIARAGCALLDRGEGQQPPIRSPQAPSSRGAEALVRRARPRPRLPRLGDLPLSGERSSHWHLVEVAASRSAAAGGAGRPGLARCRRRDGFTLTDARMNAARGAQRDSLLRALPRARQGLVLEGPARQGRQRSPSTRSASRSTGCPLDEKISEMHALRKRGDADRRARASSSLDNPMCPGTGHRICNDCMKACIYQKQEPVNIPQIETGVLTDVLEHAVGRRDLRPADALEPAQRPAAVRAAVQRQERARRRPRPGRLHARALPA